MSHHIQADVAGVIRKARHQNFPLHAALLELIDNSLDANASLIDVTEQNGDLWITDNGEGFSDVVASLVVGKSSKTSGIGRYGVGLKDASARYSNATTITSRGQTVTAPWKAIVCGESDGEVFPEEVESDERTHVVLEDFRDRYTRDICTDPIRRVYAPRLQSGDIVITLNGKRLEPLEKPDFTESIDETLEFRGRKIRLHGGIFDPSDDMRRFWHGYNPFYDGRLIGDGRITTSGVGDEACSNFSFQLDLFDDEERWVLATNKDAVDELNDAIDTCYWRYTRPLLKKAAAQAQKIELRSVEDAVNDRLAETGNQTRRRNRGRKGTVSPTQTGPTKKRTNTAREDGRYIGGNGSRGSSIQFRFVSLGGETLGNCLQHGDGVLVEANLDNGFIARNKASQDSIFGIAKLIYTFRTVMGGVDIAAEEIMERVMDNAGREMS